MSAIEAAGLKGRERELGSLREFAKERSGHTLLVSSAPGAGASGLLRAFYDELFSNNGPVAPVYFEFKASDGTLRGSAERFLHEFLIQIVAFRRREPGIAASYPDLEELGRLAPVADEAWIGELIGACRYDRRAKSDSAYIARAFGATQRAAVSGAPCLVILDGLENTLLLEGGSRATEILERVYAAEETRVIFSGLEAFITEETNRGRLAERSPAMLSLKRLDFEEAGNLAAALARANGTLLSEQARDLIVTLLEERSDLVIELTAAASAAGRDLKNFRDVLACYRESLMNGRIGGIFDSLLEDAAVPGKRTELVELLHSTVEGVRLTTPAASWLSRLRSPDALRFLEANGIVRVTAGSVRAGSSKVMADYAATKYSVDVRGESEAKISARGLSEGLKKAADAMSARYRSRRSVGLAGILSLFDCQEVPAALFDYGIFREAYKGGDIGRMLDTMRGDLEKIKLPQVFHSDRASAFYPSISEIVGDERAAIAFGFEHAEYDEDNEIVWISAEIDSKLEAGEDLAAFWCDRLEMVAVANDIERFRIWLVAPEGFSPAAQEILHSRHAIGSSAAQTRMLRNYLVSGEIGAEQQASETFSMAIPMGEDTELIAAHAVEDIARKAGFSPGDINKIKTALVEACINAAEHSHSPDKKITIDIVSGPGSITVTVANRGVRFTGLSAEADTQREERRGWGLKLIRSLMDEVKFERVDDGTRLMMVKNRRLQPA